MIFSYSKYPAPNGKSLYRSSIPVMFKNGKYFIYVEAVIDSGADFTILPIEIAGVLNLKLESKQKLSFHGAGGNPFTVYRSPIKLEHVLRQSGFRPKQWKSFVYFAESQPTILLGHNGFLDKFKVTFNGQKKQVEIQ